MQQRTYPAGPRKLHRPARAAAQTQQTQPAQAADPETEPLGDDDAQQPQPSNAGQTKQQTSTPRRPQSPASGSSSSSSSSRSKPAGGQSMPDETIFIPPAAMFILGGLGIIVGILANLWQMFTSFSAFQHIFLSGPIYKSMSAGGQDAALPVINAVCALISVSFQLAILFLVFRIERQWKEKKATLVSTASAARATAVEIVQHVPLVVVWGVLGFIADTVGDYTFIGLYSSDPFILFMYGTALYASSTIMLARAIEYVWSGVVAYHQFKAFKSSLHGR